MITTPTFEVIVPFVTWRQAVMPMLTNREQVATGPLLRDPGREPTGLLVGALSDTPRTGADFSPLADWIAIAAPEGEPPEKPDAWIRRLQPRFAQLLVILLVGLGRDRQGWRGWITERGVVGPLTGLRIIGPGMVHATHSRGGDPLDVGDDSRWSRLRGAVGESVFAKLRQTQVAVVGCSRSGTLAASMFAALGVRGLTLIDGDAIEPHNLDGILLATNKDIGSNKAVTIGHRLVDFRSDIMVQAVPHPLDTTPAAKALKSVQLIATCVDQDGPRLQAANWARAHLALHLDIGSGVTLTAAGERQMAADVRLLLPGAGCIRCVGGLRNLEQAEYEYHAPPGALPAWPKESWDGRGRLGSLITVNSMAVAVGIQSWIDLLDGTLSTSIWHRLRWNSGGGLESQSAAVAASPSCRECSGK